MTTTQRPDITKMTFSKKAFLVAAGALSFLAMGTASVGTASAGSYNDNYYGGRGGGYNHNYGGYNQSRRVYDPYLGRWIVIVFVSSSNRWECANDNDRYERHHNTHYSYDRHNNYNRTYWD